MNEALLWWGFGLLLASAVVLALELFVPSGGVLGLLSAALAIVAVVCFWRVSPAWGMSSLLAVLILGPLALGFFVKIWPDTPIGRLMILGSNAPEERDRAGREVADAARRDEMDALVGARGRAITDLRPVGVVLLDGQRREALAEGAWIESGREVRVVRVEGTQIRVREAPKA